MKTIATFCMLSLLLLCACNRDIGTPASSQPKPAVAPMAVRGAKPDSRVTRRMTPEEISRIVDSGRTGLWADTQSVCQKGPRLATTLRWNVSDTGAKRVVVYMIDKANHERSVGQGGPVGSKRTGHWLEPGRHFKIREAGTKRDLGEIVIGKKPC